MKRVWLRWVDYDEDDDTGMSHDWWDYLGSENEAHILQEDTPFPLFLIISELDAYITVTSIAVRCAYLCVVR